jgi:hypothetical protein
MSITFSTILPQKSLTPSPKDNAFPLPTSHPKLPSIKYSKKLFPPHPKKYNLNHPNNFSLPTKNSLIISYKKISNLS